MTTAKKALLPAFLIAPMLEADSVSKNLLPQGSCGRGHRTDIGDRLVLTITVMAMRKLRKS